MEKIHCAPKVLLQFKNISFCFIQCHGRVHELLSVLEKSRNSFLQCDLQKNFFKIIENLPQHLSEKFFGDITTSPLGNPLTILAAATKSDESNNCDETFTSLEANQ